MKVETLFYFAIDLRLTIVDLLVAIAMLVCSFCLTCPDTVVECSIHHKGVSSVTMLAKALEKTRLLLDVIYPYATFLLLRAYHQSSNFLECSTKESFHLVYFANKFKAILFHEKTILHEYLLFQGQSIDL